MNLFIFKSPKSFLVKNNSFQEKTKAFFISILFLIIVILIWSFFLKVIDNIHIKKYSFSLVESFKYQQTNRIFSQNFYLNIIRVILVAPVLEELAYRLLLNLKKNTFILSLATFSAIYVGDNILSLNPYSYGTWSKFSAILFIFLFGYLFVTQSFLNKIKNHFFNAFFYSLALLFALDHISLYITNLPSNLLVLAPLFVLPQFFLAITASYLRLKNGIIWAILIHILFNTPIVLNYIYSN